MRAKKSLGQNFLKWREAIVVIRDVSDPLPTDVILEIGAGKGALTEDLLCFAGKVIAVEKDKELVEFLKEKFQKEVKNKKLNILAEDILDFDPNILSFYTKSGLNYKIVANIPYYITGILLRKFLTVKLQPELMVLMLQKEVARRIVAKDGKESLLSISVKAYGKPKYVKTVPARYFAPAPKVDSAIILIDEISRNFFERNKLNEEKFFEIIRAGFAHKRKFLIGNLKKFLVFDAEISPPEKFRRANISEKARAEDLSLEDWANLIHQLV